MAGQGDGAHERFVLLVNWTDSAVQSMAEHGKRYAAAKAVMKQLGGTIETAVWTQGAFDLVLVITAASADDVSAFALTLGAKASVRTTTLRAFDEDQFDAITEKAGQLNDAYTHAYTHAEGDG